MGETGVTTTPGKAGQFMDGAKVWLSPSTIGAEFTALAAAAKLDMMGTLTSPRALGFLLVPAAAILALVLWSGVAKRRRNPGRRRAAVRRRRANPRRRAARRGNPRFYINWRGGTKTAWSYKSAKALADRMAHRGKAAIVRSSALSGYKVLYTSEPSQAARTNPKRRRNAGKRKPLGWRAEWQKKATALARAYGESPGRFGGKGKAKRRRRK